MGNYEQSTVIGSGTVPSLYQGPTHGIADGTFPMPTQRDSLRTRRADRVAVANCEDFSVNIGLLSAAVTVATSATPLPAVSLEFRRALVVHNNSSVTVFLGDSSVTTANGFPLLAGEKMAFDIQGNQNVVVYGIVDSATADVRVMELA